MEVTPMKQKLLFLALMALGGQTFPRWHHGGYWGGGYYRRPFSGYGLYGGPGYGFYGPGFYTGYYGPRYYDPVDAIVDIAGAATVNAIARSNDEYSRDSYSRKRSRDEDRDKDIHKHRRSELAGEIYDAEKELDSLKEQQASESKIKEQKAKIQTLKDRMSALKYH